MYMEILNFKKLFFKIYFDNQKLNNFINYKNKYLLKMM